MGAGFNLFLILCVCVMMGYHVRPRYGYTVRPAATHYVMGAHDYSQMHLVTVTPGDVPRFYLEGEEITGGLDGVDAALDRWKCAVPSEVVVVLVADEAVSGGTLQALVDRVLKHGYTCNIAGRPETGTHE